MDEQEHGTIYIEDEALRCGFTVIPNAIFGRRDLSPGAKLTYVCLLSYAWQKEQCFPGQDRMAFDLGVTARSVRTYLKELIECGLIVVTQRGLNRTNLYTIKKLSTE